MNNILSENLRNLRHSKNYTQAQVADILGVNPQTISRWETGIALPDVMLLPEIAKLYCVTVDDLYKEHSIAYANYAQRLASVYEHSRNLDDFLRADLEFQKLMKSNSYTTDDLRVHGIIHQYLMNECKEKALKLFDEVIQKGVEVDEEIYYQTKQQRVYFLSQIGEGQCAINEQLEIVSKANCHPKEWIVLVAACFCNNEYKKAYEYFQKAIKNNVNIAELYCYGGDICCELERYEEAFSCWDRAIELDESVMASKYSKGFCYEKLEEYDKAKEIWQDIINQLKRQGLDVEVRRVKEYLARCEEKS